MKKITTIIFILIISSLYMFSEIKIGFVNTQQIIAGTKIGFKVTKKIEAKQKVEGDKLLVLQANIDKLEKELKSKTITKDQYQQKSKEMYKAKRELKQKYDKLTADFQKYTQTELKELEKKVNPVITEIGRNKGYTAIYDIQRSGTIYINRSVNITKEVIDAINLKYPN